MSENSKDKVQIDFLRGKVGMLRDAIGTLLNIKIKNCRVGWIKSLSSDYLTLALIDEKDPSKPTSERVYLRSQVKIGGGLVTKDAFIVLIVETGNTVRIIGFPEEHYRWVTLKPGFDYLRFAEKDKD